MPSGESLNFNSQPAAEVVAETAEVKTPRSTFETRGDKTLRAEMEAREREFLEQRAAIQERRAAIQERLAEIRRQKAAIAASLGGASAGGAEPGQGQTEQSGQTNPSGQPEQPGQAPAPGNVDPGSGANPNANPGTNPGANPSSNPAPAPAPVPGATPIPGTAPQGSTSPEAPQPPTTSETPSSPESSSKSPEIDPARAEKIERINQKTKKNSGFKKIAQRVALIAMTGLIALGIGTSIFGGSRQAEATPDTSPESSIAMTVDQDQNGTGGETMEAEKGIKDGYGEKGMWLSNNKAGRYNFAAAGEVAEVCGGDETEMIKYAARNQNESFADYLANLPEQLQPEDFKGLSLLETEAKLEGLSDDDYESLQGQFGNIMDGAFTRETTLNGTYDNAFMRLKDPNGPVTHDNMELVKCTSNESNLKVTEFFWTDDGTANGNEIGSMTVKIVRDASGNIIGGCMQAVDPTGSPIYHQMPSIAPVDNTPTPPAPTAQTPNKTPTTPDTPAPETPETPDTPDTPETPDVPDTPENPDTPDNPDAPDPTPDPAPDPTPTPTPTPDPTPEWGKSGDPHSGDNRLPSDLVDPDSEVTQAENDAANAGNQGYVDDNAAAPGSGSENNGLDQDTGFASSGITAEGANTDGGRLSGGENQATETDGSAQMAGENAYNPPAQVEQGRQTDAGGNAAQQAAQETGGGSGTGATAGGDNYSNAAEESAVANGEF